MGGAGAYTSGTRPWWRVFPLALSRILPPVLLLGIYRNLPEICSERCSAGEMERREGRGPEQEGAVGTCLALGVLGCRAAPGGPTTALPGTFWTPNGIRVNGAGGRTQAGRQE